MQFRVFLLAGASCAVLTSPAFSQEIDSETSTPIVSSTFNGGAPGDVVITNSGSIELAETANVVAVTIDSDNLFTNEGLVLIEDADGVTGLLIEGGGSSNILNAGQISILEDYAREDTDGDDDLDGPLAIGADRVGILLNGSGPLTGDIVIDPLGSVDVEGNTSAAVRLESALQGDFIVDGSVSVLGDESIGIDIQNGVSGDVLLSGSVSAQGEGNVAYRQIGGIGGAFTNEGSIIATGFTSTSLSNYADPDFLEEDDTPIEERRDADELNAGGPAVAIGGGIANGFLNNGFVDEPLDEDEDETKDTVEDFNENRSTGTIISYGSAPAVLISPDLDPGGAGDLVVGPVEESLRDTLDDNGDDDVDEVLAVFDYPYGFINRGTIEGNGLNIGFDATALRIEGAADGTRSTVISGGLFNSGSIVADAFEGNATALSIGLGADVALIENEGVIDADVFTETDHRAVAVLIEDGAAVPTILNSGFIEAVTNANDAAGRATAILDQSGSVRLVENTYSIAALVTDDDGAVVEAANTVALDFSAHGAGESVRVLQYAETPTEDVNDDGEINEDDAPTPFIIGDIIFGAGDDELSVSAGSVSGDVYFGLGDDIFSLTSGAAFNGNINDTDGALSLFISDASFTFESADPLEASVVSITGASVIEFGLDFDGASLGAPLITASDSAVLGDEVVIETNFSSFNEEPENFILLQSPDLQFEEGGPEAILLDAPFIYASDLTVEGDALILTLDRKTPEQLGLNANQTSAYDAVLNVLETSEETGAAFLRLDEQDAFLSGYDQILPSASDAAGRFLRAQSRKTAEGVSDRLKRADIADSAGGFWLQQYWTYMDAAETAEAPGFDGLGFSLLAGRDWKLSNRTVAGLTGSFSSGEFSDKNDAVDSPVSTTSFQLGAFAFSNVAGFEVSGSASGGPVWFNSDRQLTFGGLTETYEGSWSGYSAAASFGVSRTFSLGPVYARPEIGADYFRMHQEGYEETGPDDGVMALSVGEVDTDTTSASAILTLGLTRDAPTRAEGARQRPGQNAFNASPFRFEPVVYGGVRANFSTTPYEAEAAFLDTGDTFEIVDYTDDENGFVFGAALDGGNEYYGLSFNYEAELQNDVTTHQAGVTFHLRF